MGDSGLTAFSPLPVERGKSPRERSDPLSFQSRGDLSVFMVLGLCVWLTVLVPFFPSGAWASSGGSGGVTSKECLMCHADPDKLPDTPDIAARLHVASGTYHESAHGSVKCTGCHYEHEGLVHYGSVEGEMCKRCHDRESDAYSKSIHAKARLKGSTEAATCQDCHGKSHGILPSDNPQSKTYPARLPKTCGSCHSRPEIIKLLKRRGGDRVELYRESVHGQLLQDYPDTKVATCNDCHGTHKILPPINPQSTLNVFNLAETCGECHQKEKEHYRKSIHWKSLERGNYEAPTCTDCHGEHKVEAPVMNNGEIEVKAVTKICATCHSSETLMSRFGLDHRRIETYFRSYHGLAGRKGSREVAACSSCHENHAIRGSGNPRSTIHPSNLKETCSRCHEGVTANFARIDVHPTDQQSRNPVAYYIRMFYIYLIIGVIGLMLAHNLLIVFYHVRRKLRDRRNQTLYRRFQSFEVYQHFLLFLCFTTLVVTGFALKFPDAGWVRLLLGLGLDEAARSLTHRIAAVVLVAISLVQLVYFVIHSEGRRDVRAMLPKREDLSHLWQNVKYHLGWSREVPEYGRFTYAEKAEYLAMIWGVVVMGASGVVLWFPAYFLEFLPWWSFETVEVIHYYEAWLATLAILVWHFFFVIFHPEKYPLDLTVLDGAISEEELRDHHPKEYERLKQEGDDSDEPRNE